MSSEGFDQNARWNQQAAAVLVDACCRQGATDFFLAPGSRCTPLTLELARRVDAGDPVTVHQHFDERGLAFACVGYGKATGRPAVFVCTSGTAAANAFPAVIESSAEDVPLLLLTADRPSELRGSGSNQTIDQVHLFGKYPRSFLDLPCSQIGSDPTAWVQPIEDAVAASVDGPVHLNCMFGQPLHGLAMDATDAVSPMAMPAESRSGRAAVRTTETERRSESVRLYGGNTLVIASGCTREHALAAQRLARRLRAVFVADVTSGLRTLAHDCVLARWERSERPAFRRGRPDTVIHVGRRITSKRLLAFLNASHLKDYLHIHRTDQPIDPLRKVTHRRIGDVAVIADHVALERPSSAEFAAHWQSASDAARRACETVFASDGLSEPALAHAIARAIPTDCGLFLGNSMPVRDMDTFGFWDDDKVVHVMANRGASGIDGTIATAIGFANGLGRPTTAIIGDLAALHDLNALAMLKRSSTPVVLVVVNNDGGGIFHFLPIAETARCEARPAAWFEQYFGTPHGRRFELAARMFEVAYRSPTSMGAFRADYLAALKVSHATILEVATDRLENVRRHRQMVAPGGSRAPAEEAADPAEKPPA